MTEGGLPPSLTHPWLPACLPASVGPACWQLGCVLSFVVTRAMVRDRSSEWFQSSSTLEGLDVGLREQVGGQLTTTTSLCGLRRGGERARELTKVNACVRLLVGVAVARCRACG